MSTNTLITDIDDKMKGCASLPNETIIYEQEIEESPKRHRFAPPKLED